MKFIKKEWGEASYRKLHLQKGLGIMGMVLAFLFAENIYAQDSQTIKGMVRDVTGEPLIGASVIEKGTNNGVITDVDGNFPPMQHSPLPIWVMPPVKSNWQDARNKAIYE